MTSEQLHFFLITAKHLNFSAAAKELYVTQPTISHQIAMLEKELGARLFTRSTRKIQLTRSGELFLEDAKRIMDIEDAAKERVQLADAAGSLNLKIAYLLSPCQVFLPGTLAEFRKNFPQVRTELIRMDAKNIIMSMDKDFYDIYFSLSNDLRMHHRYAYKDMFTDTLSLICSTDHPCASLTKIDFNKLASEHFIMFDPEHASLIHKQVQQFCRSINFMPQSMSFRHSMEEVLFEVESGMGVAILPMRNKQSSPASVAYIPLSGNFTQLNLGVAWQVGSENPAIGWFLDTLDQSKEANPNWF